MPARLGVGRDAVAVLAGQFEKFLATGRSALRPLQLVAVRIALLPVAVVGALLAGRAKRAGGGPVRHARLADRNLPRQDLIMSLRQMVCVFHHILLCSISIAQPMGMNAVEEEELATRRSLKSMPVGGRAIRTRRPSRFQRKAQSRAA